jgi:hypothetical protein
VRLLEKLKIPKHLIEYFEQNGNQIKTIGSFLLILGATNYIPRNWWQSWILNWELPSQSVISLLSILILLCHSLYSEVKNLESYISKLESPKTPEQEAKIIKERFNKRLSIISHFLPK